MDKIKAITNKIGENNFLRMLIGAVIGVVSGYLYWRYIGCSSGSCSITSNPYKTTLLFGLMGLIFARKSNK